MMKWTKTFRNFFESERSGGLILILCTITSMLIANSSGTAFLDFWKFTIGGHTITEWINDGLMTFFFLLIGLELEREVYAGELSDKRVAILPILAAIGGVLVPSLIYASINKGTETISGTGIPMATDIAFAVGVLGLLGNRVPIALRVFITALAVIDDLIAIVIIAVFYSYSLSFYYLILSLLIFGMLLYFNKKKVNNSIPYVIGGILMWYCMMHSGIHPTLSGVLLAFALPFDKGDKRSISYRWQNHLHYPVAFFVLPLFALANTAIIIPNGSFQLIMSKEGLGIILGLVMGKPLGIFIFSLTAVHFGICQWPEGIKPIHILGAGILAGIGFTMSIFITLLAFQNEEMVIAAKIAIITASVISGILGVFFLNLIFQKKEKRAGYFKNTSVAP